MYESDQIEVGGKQRRPNLVAPGLHGAERQSRLAYRWHPKGDQPMNLVSVYYTSNGRKFTGHVLLDSPEPDYTVARESREAYRIEWRKWRRICDRATTVASEYGKLQELSFKGLATFGPAEARCLQLALRLSKFAQVQYSDANQRYYQKP